MMGTILNTPIVFHPIYKQLIWGGDKIARFKNINIDMHSVGESWELSTVTGNVSIVAECEGHVGWTITELIANYGASLLGTKVYKDGDNNFPLLIKFIDAQRDLSVQVHPNDKLAHQRHNSPGKTEMWYILDAEDDAKIYCGFSAPLTPNNYRKCIHDSKIMDYVASYNSDAGQFYFVPAGTIHAIGAGNLVAEIQQTCNITYRIYDFDRLDVDGSPRQLHTDLAFDAIDYTYPNIISPCAMTVNETQAGVVKSDYFTVDFISLSCNAQYSVSHSGESFRIIMVTNGNLNIICNNKVYNYAQGSTILMPASIHSFAINGIGNALIIYC